jgi:glutaredoxin
MRGQSLFGSALLVFGALLGFLAVVHGTTGLPFAMPRFWYVNDRLWVVFAIAFVVAGSYVLRMRPPSSLWHPSEPGRRFRRVVLYTRAGCHLCDEAKSLLLEYADYLPAVREIDIDKHVQLVKRFGTCVPVVEIDGKVRFRGRVNEALLRRLIEGTPPVREAEKMLTTETRRHGE